MYYAHPDGMSNLDSPQWRDRIHRREESRSPPGGSELRHKNLHAQQAAATTSNSPDHQRQQRDKKELVHGETSAAAEALVQGGRSLKQVALLNPTFSLGSGGNGGNSQSNGGNGGGGGNGGFGGNGGGGGNGNGGNGAFGGAGGLVIPTVDLSFFNKPTGSITSSVFQLNKGSFSQNLNVNTGIPFFSFETPAPIIATNNGGLTQSNTATVTNTLNQGIDIGSIDITNSGSANGGNGGNGGSGTGGSGGAGGSSNGGGGGSGGSSDSTGGTGGNGSVPVTVDVNTPAPPPPFEVSAPASP
ncbi:hypothetical protein N2152v2_006897 [Parachlorella kessleri]